MSRKHNTKHDERGTSNYAQRPGMYGTGRPMDTLEHLRDVQERRVKHTGSPVFMGYADQEANHMNAQRLIGETFEAA